MNKQKEIIGRPVANTKKNYIMVFNDTVEILQLFEDILTAEGYTVSLHTLGERDVEAVKHSQPDLIISDHSVTREELGWVFLQKLKMVRETAKIPLIVCTTNMRVVEDSQGQFAAMGVKILPKPFELEQLLTKVEEAMDGANTNNGETIHTFGSEES